MERRLKKIDERLDTFLGSGLTVNGSADSQSIEARAYAELNKSITALQKEMYHVIYHSSMNDFMDKLMTESMEPYSKVILQKYETEWNLFEDKTDKIKIQGMSSPTHFKNKNILFVASFHDNAVTLSQFHVIAFLCECLAQSLTILLPFYSTGTMERVDIDDNGVIPTANTLALLFNGLPSVGRPIRVMTYDLHTLQNRFYFTGHAVATLHTAIPLIVEIIEKSKLSTDLNPINAVAFPDAGAQKRFGGLLEKAVGGPENIIICSKVRKGKDVITTIADGVAHGKHVLIVDDQTKSGTTLFKCAEKLKEPTGGATHVSAYVTHFVPIESAKKEIEKLGIEGAEDKGIFSIFEHFYYTDSVPDTTNIHTKYSGKFRQLPLAKLVLDNL